MLCCWEVNWTPHSHYIPTFSFPSSLSKFACINSPIFYEHWGCQGGQIFSCHQLHHQRLGLRVDGAGLGGQQARLGSIGEEVWQELVVSGHGGVDVLVPECRRVAVHLHGATGNTQMGQTTGNGGVYGCLFVLSHLYISKHKYQITEMLLPHGCYWYQSSSLWIIKSLKMSLLIHLTILWVICLKTIFVKSFLQHFFPLIYLYFSWWRSQISQNVATRGWGTCAEQGSSCPSVQVANSMTFDLYLGSHALFSNTNHFTHFEACRLNFADYFAAAYHNLCWTGVR